MAKIYDSDTQRKGMPSWSDMMLGAGVICIVTLMIIPLPTLLIDVLVAINMIMSVLILMIGIYTPTAVGFSTYPSVLLISAIFRLSLSIAITRKILITGDGGQIVETFGRLLVGGNLVIGLVIFLVITTVQFIVIAKGAERVAEVAARFTLDAMPGKQLSIDSDLRSGFIDKDEARRRRVRLQQESHLHGSLDGAMKFVKGESIASIIIVFINLLGGLAIGMTQRGMDFGTAINTYSLLSIGDGLISQIPALLGAMTAGLIVTKSSDESQNTSMAQSMHQEVTAIPLALTICGVVALMMGIIPGFPWWAFFTLGAGAIIYGFILSHPEKFNSLMNRQSIPEANTNEHEIINYTNRFKHAEPISLSISHDIYDTINHQKLQAKITKIRDEIIDSLGAPIPRVLVLRAENIPYRSFQIAIYDVVEANGSANESTIESEIINQLALEVKRIINFQAFQFIGIQETNILLQKSAQTAPDLVKELTRQLPPQTIASILKNLIEEGIGIRNLKQIFETLIETSPKEKDGLTLLEYVRVSLKKHTLSQFVKDGEPLKTWVLSPDLEDTLRQSIRNTPLGAHLALEESLNTRILAQVNNCKNTVPDFARTQVIMTTIDLRRHFRSLIKTEHSDIFVLSYHETEPRTKLSVSGIINA